jgi:hypothetical protein
MCSSRTLYSGTSRVEISVRRPAIPTKFSNSIRLIHNVIIGKVIENDTQADLFSLGEGNYNSKCNFKREYVIEEDIKYSYTQSNLFRVLVKSSCDRTWSSISGYTKRIEMKGPVTIATTQFPPPPCFVSLLLLCLTFLLLFCERVPCETDILT